MRKTNSIDTLMLNFVDEGLKPVISVTQYDSGRHVTCKMAGLTGELDYASVYCVKPSGLEAYVPAKIVDDHTIEFDIDPQMIAEVGSVPCQLQIFGEGNTLTSFEFVTKVRRNLVANSRLDSSDAYPALQDLLETLTAFKPIPITEEEIDELKGVVT